MESKYIKIYLIVKCWGPGLTRAFPEALMYRGEMSLAKLVKARGSRPLKKLQFGSPRTHLPLASLKACVYQSQGHQGAFILGSTRNIRCSLRGATLLDQLPTDSVRLCYHFRRLCSVSPLQTVYKILHFLIYLLDIRHSLGRTSWPQPSCLHLFPSSPSPPSQEHAAQEPPAGPGQWKCVSSKKLHSFRLTTLTRAKFIELHRLGVLLIWVCSCFLFALCFLMSKFFLICK